MENTIRANNLRITFCSCIFDYTVVSKTSSSSSFSFDNEQYSQLSNFFPSLSLRSLVWEQQEQPTENCILYSHKSNKETMNNDEEDDDQEKHAEINVK